MPTMTDKPLMNAEDIVKILGKSKYTVMRLFQSHEIPGFKIGGQWYITPEDWNKYIEEKRNQHKK